MRLLNSSTLKFREFSGGRIPPYAALSHRWEEITFDDMSDWQNQDNQTPKARSGLKTTKKKREPERCWAAVRKL
jgi:hypothetical protein